MDLKKKTNNHKKSHESRGNDLKKKDGFSNKNSENKKGHSFKTKN